MKVLMFTPFPIAHAKYVGEGWGRILDTIASTKRGILPLIFISLLEI